MFRHFEPFCQHPAPTVRRRPRLWSQARRHPRGPDGHLGDHRSGSATPLLARLGDFEGSSGPPSVAASGGLRSRRERLTTLGEPRDGVLTAGVVWSASSRTASSANHSHIYYPKSSLNRYRSGSFPSRTSSCPVHARPVRCSSLSSSFSPGVVRCFRSSWCDSHASFRSLAPNAARAQLHQGRQGPARPSAARNRAWTVIYARISRVYRRSYGCFRSCVFSCIRNRISPFCHLVRRSAGSVKVGSRPSSGSSSLCGVRRRR